MLRLSSVLAAVCALIPAALFAQDPPPPAQQPPPIREVRISGTRELTTAAVIDALPVHAGEPMADTPERVSERVERLYREEGYTFARVKTDVDPSGALTITIDEGVIDAVEFDGIDDRLADTFAEEFALHAGDVFNIGRARQALTALLRPTRGAITPSRITFADPPPTFHDTRELRERRGTFDLVERDGQRILRVGLREPAGRFKLSPNLGNREDWFTPVDGFVPALDFGAVAFEHGHFNPATPGSVPIVVDLGDRGRLGAAEQYYVHVVATLGTLAAREADDVGDAVFGRESEANGLGSLGRLVFKTALKVSDYLQSVSAEAKSRKLLGREIIRP